MLIFWWNASLLSGIPWPSAALWIIFIIRSEQLVDVAFKFASICLAELPVLGVWKKVVNLNLLWSLETFVRIRSLLLFSHSASSFWLDSWFTRSDSTHIFLQCHFSVGFLISYNILVLQLFFDWLLKPTVFNKWTVFLVHRALGYSRIILPLIRLWSRLQITIHFSYWRLYIHCRLMRGIFRLNNRLCLLLLGS